MKKILNISCVAAAIVALASCTQENIEKVNTGAVKYFEAGFTNTKTAVDAQYKTTWVEGDKVVVLNNLNNKDVVAIKAEDAGKAAADIATTIADADNYYAVYGDENAAIVSSAIDVNVATSQSGNWADAQIAAAIAVDDAFALKNISSVLEFQVSADVKSVTFEATGDDTFTTEGYVTFDKDNLPVVASQATSKTITVNTNKVAGTYYACVLPSELTSLTINIEYDADTKVTKINAPFNLAANKVTKFGELESHNGKVYKTVTKTAFTAVTGSIDAEGTVTYKANQGGAGTAPGIYNEGIRLYQGNPGGNIEITSTTGDKIKAIKLTTTSQYATTKVDVKGGTDAANSADAVDFPKSTTKMFNGFDASKVTVYNFGSTSSNRLEIYAISVTYEVDTRTAQTLSFPQASYSAKVGQPFSAPTVSGAETTVTYSSNNEEVATVNSATGEVTIIGAGKCVISATAAENATYKEGFASYELTAAAGATGIAGIKALLRAGGSNNTDFAADVTDMVITYLKDDAYPHIAYAEDASGDAIYIYYGNNTLPVAAGDKFNGSISGTGKVYKGCVEITALNISEATKTTGSKDPIVVTIETLLANYADYEFRMIKIENAEVTTACTETVQAGTIQQSGNSITLNQGQKGFAPTTVGKVCDFICFPDYKDTEKQLMIWSSSQITEKSSSNTITMAATKTIAVGEEWTIGATCLDGTVDYQIIEGSDKITLTSGKVTGVAAGTAKVKATSSATGGFTASEAVCTITVTDGSSSSTTYTWTLKSGELKTTAGTVTANSATWSFPALTYTGFDAGKGAQIGSSKNPTTSCNINTEYFKDKTIQSITVNASMGSSGNAKLTISVGGTDILSNQSLTTSATDYTANSITSKGKIEVKFEATAKAYYLKSITVVYK